MRIAVNATCIHGTSSGLGVVTENLTTELLGQHDDLIAYTVSHEVERTGGASVHRATKLIAPEHGTLGHLARMIWCQTRLPWLLSRDGAGILYSPVEEGILWGRAKQVVTVHDLLPLEYPEIYPRKKHVFRRILPRQLRKASAVICVSEFTRRAVIERFGLSDKPTFVVHNGLDHELFRPKESSLPKENYGLDRYVLYVGEMRPYKNLGRALEAFAKLDDFDCTFAVAGRKDRHFFPALERRAKALGVSDRIAFLGYVPAEHLPHLYSSAQAFVFPSLYEGFGMPPIEAMACGCPVITSRIGGLPEACGDAALYVDPEDVESIADGLRQIQTNSRKRDALVEEGLRQAANFSWEKAAGEVLEILRLVAGETSSDVGTRSSS